MICPPQCCTEVLQFLSSVEMYTFLILLTETLITVNEEYIGGFTSQKVIT